MGAETPKVLLRENETRPKEAAEIKPTCLRNNEYKSGSIRDCGFDLGGHKTFKMWHRKSAMK